MNKNDSSMIAKRKMLFYIKTIPKTFTSTKKPQV